MNDTTLIKDLKKLLGDRFTQSESAKLNHAKGEDAYDPVLPLAVVFPNSNEDISEILKICNKYSTPITTFGTGTSLEGQAVGNSRGITMSLQNLNKIL